MKPVFYAKLGLTGAPLDAVVSNYVQWILGRDQYAQIRERRLDVGVSANWPLTLAETPGDYVGVHDCALSVRRAEGVALVKWSHRDRDDGSVLWHSLVRLRRSDDGVIVEHGVARSAPRDVVLRPIAASPMILATLIKDFGAAGVVPRELYTTTAQRYRDHDSVTAFVEHVLLDTARTIPIVVVTPRGDTGYSDVDVAKLAKLLAGTATVVELEGRASTHAFSSALAAAGFDRQYSCFDGGVRIYEPHLDTADAVHRHYLWIKTRIEQFSRDPERRTEIMAGLIANRIVAYSWPSGFTSLVQDFDREERRRHAERLLAEHLPTALAGGTATADEVAQRDRKIIELEVALRKEVDVTQKYFAEEHRAMEEQCAKVKDQNTRLEYEAEVSDQRIDDLQAALDRSKQEKNVGVISDDVRVAVEAALDETLTPEQALRVVSVLYASKVVILDSAWRSARKSAEFFKPLEVLNLLRKLVTSYWDALHEGGKGDAEARKIFGNHFSATDSEKVMNNKTAKKLRTFRYNGEDVEMFGHLKIGVKDSAAETIRIHFIWDASKQQVVIGYCGPHLDHD